jgi:hypothetical protein
MSGSTAFLNSLHQSKKNMKIKSSTLGNRVSLLLILLSTNACQTDESETRSPSNPKLLSSQVVADAISVYAENDGSLSAMRDFLNSEYGIDFNAGYEMLMPYFKPTHSNKKGNTVSEVDMGAVDEILFSLGVGTSSPIYEYLQNVSGLFDGGLLSEDEIRVELETLKAGILQNDKMTDKEKDKLATVATVVLVNFTGIVDVVADGYTAGSEERTQGWFNKVWRVVRSVVVTAALGAIVGALSTDEDGNVIVNAVVGSAIGGVAAIVDAAANDHCHFALQCSGGWRQNCSSGECEPYIR